MAGDDAKLADARKRVTRAERKALDRALALRDEATALLESARDQAKRIRTAADDAAAVTREEARIEVEALRAAPPRREKAVAVAYRPRPDTDRLLAEARAEAERLRAEVDKLRGELDELQATPSSKGLGLNGSGPAPPTERLAPSFSDEDVIALAALVESVEKERDALAAELASALDELASLRANF